MSAEEDKVTEILIEDPVKETRDDRCAYSMIGGTIILLSLESSANMPGSFLFDNFIIICYIIHQTMVNAIEQIPPSP